MKGYQLYRSRMLLLGVGLWSAVVLLSPLFAAEVIIPPPGSSAVLQTNGPNGELDNGDYWSNNDVNAGQQPHLFLIFVPCAVPGDFEIQLQIFDPECYATGSELDERKGGVWDQTHFRLIAPNGTDVVADTYYPPVDNTSEVWVPFANFSMQTFGCGIYRLYVTTENDDENTYRLRIVENDPDGVPNSGDEINIGLSKSSHQMIEESDASLHFYVPPAMPELILANFDLDDYGTVTYVTPGGEVLTGTTSGDAVWNNSAALFLPPPGGDVYAAPESGWWRANIASVAGNQFSFYPGLTYFLQAHPESPRLNISLQDGRENISKGAQTTYTIRIDNVGAGAATACQVIAYLSPGLIITDPGSGTPLAEDRISWDFGPLPPGQQALFTMSVVVGDGATNPVVATASVTYENVLFFHYASPYVLDINQLQVAGAISGTIWHDSNHNGLRESMETGLGSVRTFLVAQSGDTIAEIQTNSEGFYLFTDLPIGEYQVRPENAFFPEDWDVTTTVQNTWLVITDLGETHANIDIGYGKFETPVELATFSGKNAGVHIELNWVTESETDNLGFHIYRSESADGAYARINSALIPGAGSTSNRQTYRHRDEQTLPGKSYFYKLSDISYKGVETMHGPIAVQSAALPEGYSLGQNYPNPFNGGTTIPFELKERGEVHIVLYNLLGQKIRSVVEGVLEAGAHRVHWDGCDDRGREVPAGVYLYSMTVNDYRSMRRLQFIK